MRWRTHAAKMRRPTVSAATNHARVVEGLPERAPSQRARARRDIEDVECRGFKGRRVRGV
jgi:hypothetical protein